MILHLKNPKKLHHKTPRHHKQPQQNSRIQNQCTKISSLSYTNNEQIEKEYRKTIPLKIASKKNQKPRNKLNKFCELLLQGKLQTTEEGN
jgi:hypothetical protein